MVYLSHVKKGRKLLMDRIVYRGLLVGIGLLKKLYYGLILIMIASTVVQEIGAFIDYIPLVENTYMAFVIVEMVAVLLYFATGLLIRVTETQIGIEGSLLGTEMWQIVRSWKFFKEDILKDALILNGFLVTLMSFILNWVVK